MSPLRLSSVYSVYSVVQTFAPFAFFAAKNFYASYV